MHKKELDADDLNRLTRDAVLGIEPTIPGEVARAMYEQIKRDVDKAKRDGLQIDMIKE